MGFRFLICSEKGGWKLGSIMITASKITLKNMERKM
jgi:hypothetical protein